VAERKSVITYHYKPNTDKASSEGNVRRTRISSAGGDVVEVATASATCRKQKEPDAITVERRQKKIRPAMTAVKTTTLRWKMKGLKMKGMQELSQNHKNQQKQQQQGQGARKPSRPVAKKIRSQGPSRVSATASKPKTSSL
jgi:hypothetical protein